MTAPKRLMTAQQTADFLGISYSTLWRWNLLRAGPPKTRHGKRYFYVREIVKDWLSQNAPAGASASIPAPASSRPRSLLLSCASTSPR